MECLLHVPGRSLHPGQCWAPQAGELHLSAEPPHEVLKGTGAQEPRAKAQQSREPGQSWRSIAWLDFPGRGSGGRDYTL